MNLPPNTQYLRFFRLVVGPIGGGDGLDLSQFKVVFRVESPIIQTPNSAVIRIFNLGYDTTQQLRTYNVPLPDPINGNAGQTPPSGQVIIDAGYINAQQGNIFKGDIVQVRVGRVNQVDTYVDIYARDSDPAHLWGMVNGTLSRGYHPADVQDQVAQAYKPYGVTGGNLPSNIQQQPAPRAKVMHGMGKDFLDDLGHTYEFSWSADRKQLVYVPYNALRGGGAAIVLNSRTGLIGMPVLTTNGVSGKCLLNPAIDWGTHIQINNADIQVQASYNLEWTAQNYIPGANSIAKGGDGEYKVLKASHIGDTWGNEWYTEFDCISIDPSATPASVPKSAIPP